MATVVLFHSVYGLRSLEKNAAMRLQAAGHEVLTPDLYGGLTAETVEDGFAIKDEIGWQKLCARAEAAVAGVPKTAVLGGFSMGAGIAASLWEGRPQTSGLLFLHGIADIPQSARADTPVQVHLADPDPYETAEWVAAFQQASAQAHLATEFFSYAGVGHLFADASLPDYDVAASDLMWARVTAFLAAL